jgi:triosephosphate isomerase
MSWTGNVAGMEKSTDAHWVLVGKSERRGHLKDLGVDGRIILKWIIRKLDEDLK